MTTFRDLLNKAREDRDGERTQKTTMAFTAFFGMPPDKSDGMDAWKDDIHLRRIGHGEAWIVVGQCPRCEGELVSYACFSVVSVAEVIDNFYGNAEEHRCKNEFGDSTVEEA